MFTLFVIFMFGYIVYAVFQIFWLILSFFFTLLGLGHLFDWDDYE